MKLINLGIEKLEQRIAPGGIMPHGGGCEEHDHDEGCDKDEHEGDCD